MSRLQPTRRQFQKMSKSMILPNSVARNLLVMVLLHACACYSQINDEHFIKIDVDWPQDDCSRIHLFQGISRRDICAALCLHFQTETHSIYNTAGQAWPCFQLYHSQTRHRDPKGGLLYCDWKTAKPKGSKAKFNLPDELEAMNANTNQYGGGKHKRGRK